MAKEDIENKEIEFVSDIPYDKHECYDNLTDEQKEKYEKDPSEIDLTSVCPAFNSGKVVLKCLINGMSPFMKTTLVNDSLFFNGRTFGKKILEMYPENVKNSIESFGGEDGITLKPKIIYRHTYITAKPKVGSQLYLDNIWDDLDSLDERIDSQINYKEHQTFVISSSLFSEKIKTPSEYVNFFGVQNINCLTDAIWQYSFFNTESWSNEEDDNNDNFVERLPESVEIQYPSQIASDTCGGYGIHWGLEKKTPLFEGEDFYIEFRKQSSSSNIPSLKKEQKLPTLIPYLDSRKEFDVDRDPETGLLVFENQALVDFDPEFDPYTGKAINLITIKESRKTFDFTNQSYYIIRLGSFYSDLDSLYYIIICQKANPIFIRVKNGITWRISEFEGYNANKEIDSYLSSIGGKELISSDWFRMEVRNLLGKLVIHFIGPNFKSSPWIIERLDRKIKGGNQRRILKVPRGSLGILGGNILTGFSFGPIQYVDGVLMRHPSETMSYELENLDADFSLPSDSSSQEVLLSSTDYLIDASKIENLMPGESLLDRKMYTQDAQVFVESIDGEQVSTDGSFFGFRPLRELPVDKEIVKKSFRGELPPDGNLSGYLDLDKINNALSKSRIVVIKKDKEYKYDKDKSVEENVFEELLYQDRRRNKFYLEIFLGAGDHSFIEPLRGPDGTAIINDDGIPSFSRWDVKSCIPPVLSMIRLVARANEEPRWDVESLDASEHVMEFSETWNASDFSKISHTGNIKFLLNEGMKTNNDATEHILSLRDKSFYIEIWGGYGYDDNDNFLKNVKTCNYSRIPGLYKLFTGICHGGAITRSYGKRIMDCRIDDYNDVLKNIKFFNAPFWDGVKDVNAMNELLEIAGFRKDLSHKKVSFNNKEGDEPKEIKLNNYGPRHFVDKLSTSASKSQIDIVFPDGRSSYSKVYALPSSYTRLTQPFFKAKDGDKLQDMAIKIAERGGKVFFFDQFGAAHFEDFFDHFRNAVIEGENDEYIVFKYTTNPDIWGGQLIFNNMTVQHDVQSTFNHIKLLTNTPDFSVDFFDDVNWDSYDDPGSEGFIGYLKMFYQAEGVIGSKVGSQNLLDFYKRTLFKPPLIVSFESYGQPLRSLDLISLNDVPLRVMKVDNTIDPSRNVWWQKVECEWSQWAKPIPSDNLMTRIP